MRNRTRLFTALRKNAEISRSRQGHWISLIIFLVPTLLFIAVSATEPSGEIILVAISFTLISLNLILGIIKLRKLKKNLLKNPQKYKQKHVPKILSYRVIFWGFPK